MKELSYIVATHPHKDHMGGLPGALFQAKAKHALCSVSADDTVFFRTFTTFLDKQGAALTVPRPGDTFPLGSATVEVLGPVDRTTPYTNDMSLVLRVTYGNTAFLFTGDGEEPEERAWVLNTATKKFHRMFCFSAVQMDDGKRRLFEGSREELLDMGYEPCNWCDDIESE